MRLALRLLLGALGLAQIKQRPGALARSGPFLLAQEMKLF
jgi:hypothetical protein